MNKILFLLSGLLLTCNIAESQPCTKEALMQLPGKWKKGMQGSIHNVSADNLAKEKAVLAEIHKMTSSGYQPYGLDVHHSTVFGYNLVNGKKWYADPFYYNAYLMDYLCDHRDNDIKKMWVNPETGTTGIVYINRIDPFPDGSGADIYPATFPEDRHDPFERIDSWPQQKDGYWYWLIQDSANERYPKKMYYYLITYDGQLPFTKYTKKEYLEYQIPRMKKSLAERTKYASEIDPNSYDEKRFLELKAATEEELNEFRKKIKQTEQLLVTMSPQELAEVAIVKNDGYSEFYGFFKEGDPYTSILIKPNPAYYKPLPKWVPQFFCVAIKLATDMPVFRKAIPDFEKSLDFTWFRKMLGSTTIIPYQRSGTSQSPVATSQPAAFTPKLPVSTSSTSSTGTTSKSPAAPAKKNTETPVSGQSSNTFDPSQPVYDLDGNAYTVLKIGKLYWFKENLRTSQYNDTTAIATGLSDNEWKQTKKGAFAVYENNPLYNTAYGKLYNGYAVRTGKLCPKGWRIPTDKDWNELEQFLGIPAGELERTGERGSIADKIKTTDGWKESGFSKNNSSGFSIKPAGVRLDNGEFTTIGQYGNFWTSTVYDDRYGLLYLWNHHVHYNTNAVGRIYTLANNGYSCRCVADSIVIQKTNTPSPSNKPAENKKVSTEYKSVSYDLATFSVPKTWIKESGKMSEAYLITDAKTGEYAKIIVYQSLAGSGNLQTDFSTEWRELIEMPYKSSAASDVAEKDLPDSWKIKVGVAPFAFNSKKSEATLITAVSNGQKMSLVMLSNTDKYQNDFESIARSVKFKKVEPLQMNPSSSTVKKNSPAVSAGFTFITTNFDDGWTSTVANDYVLVEKAGNSVYLLYAVPYNASQFSGTGLRDAEYYWDQYVTQFFTTKTKQFNDGGSIGFKPPYMEGYAIDKRTGKSCFIGMYLNIIPNAVKLVIGTAPDEAAFRQLFPRANDEFTSDLSAMVRYNKFAVASSDLPGTWQEGGTNTAQWYYTSPSGYEGYAGMTAAATSATFNFHADGTYSSIHNGATGAVGNMNTFQQEYKGTYTVTNWNITATNRWQGKTAKFEASFEAVRGGRILKLNDNAGGSYNLVKVK